MTAVAVGSAQASAARETAALVRTEGPGVRLTGRALPGLRRQIGISRAPLEEHGIDGKAAEVGEHVCPHAVERHRKEQRWVKH